MSDTITLAAEVREAGKNLQTLRGKGLIPAILYGRGIESKPLSLDHRAFARAFRAAGENTIIALSTGTGKPVNVIVKDAQMDPISNRFTHADFFQVRMDEAIDADIPFEFVGEAPAVRELGGILVKALENVEVNALPGDLPHTLMVDLSKLVTFDDVIKIKDLAIPAKVTVKDDIETVVALVEAPRSEAELEKLDEKAEADVTKVEKVEKKPEGEASAAETK
jgi:large subunit ribosomal protein L25